MKQKKFQDRHQSRLTDFKNSVLDYGNCETIVLFNQTNAYRRNTAILDTANRPTSYIPIYFWDALNMN